MASAYCVENNRARGRLVHFGMASAEEADKEEEEE